jgi:hypothetical protein
MPFDSSYTPPQAPAGLLTMQDADAKALNLRNAVQAGQLGQQQLAEGGQRMQANALELKQKQLQMDQTRAVNDAYRDALTIGPDGAASIDSTKITRALSAAGHGSAVPGILEANTKYQQANAALRETMGKVKVQEADAAGAMGATLEAAGDDPHLFLTMAQHEINAKTVDGAAIQPLMQRVAQSLVDDPTGAAAKGIVGQIRTQLVAASGEQQKQLAAMTTADARKKAADTGAERQANEAAGQIADATQKQVAALAPQLEAALKKGGPDAVNALLDQAPHGVAKRFANVTGAGGFNAAALTPDQKVTTDQAALNATNTEADRKVTQDQGRQRLAIESRNAGINAQKFAMEFGGNAVKGWAKQVADNPDTANQVPPALRTAVMQQFTADNGLPFPKPLTGTAVDQERASRNALDAVAQVQEALKDPEVQSSLGPIMGRLGNAQQDMGTSLGLSPSAAKKAQQLRTNMRYLVFQEGKALLGGRMPEKLMQALESSSPSVKMDADTMAGAMAGVSDAANRNLEQSYKQRFGAGATRPSAAAPAAGIDPAQNPFRQPKK